jgi:hypothetical protein
VASKPTALSDSPARAARSATIARSDVRSLSDLIIEAVVALAMFTGLAVVVTWPLAADLRTRIYGYPGDSTGTIAFLWSSAHKVGYHLLGSTHIRLTGAPFGWDFADTLNVQWGFVLGPAVLVTKLFGEVVAYNLAVLSGLALSGASMYLLVRWLGAPPAVAAWAGLAYTIFPWHLEKAQGHLTFVHLEGFPLLLLATFAWYRRPDWVHALWIALASLVLWTTAGYFGLVALVALAVLLPVLALAQRRRVGTGTALRNLVVAGGFALAVPVGIFALSLWGPHGKALATARSVGDLNTYGARPWEYFLPSYRSTVFGGDVRNFLGAHLHGSNFSETSLYVGWIPLVFAVGFVVTAFVRRRTWPFEQKLFAVLFSVLGIGAVIFSLPSPLPKTDIPGPSRLLWQLVPQFRVSSRFVALVMTALVPLAALGLEALRRSLARRGRAGLVASVSVVALAAVGTTVEFWLNTSTSDVSHVPPYYRVVERAPRGNLAEYPLAKAEQAVNSDYLFWQRVHRRPLINGAATNSFAETVGQSVASPVSPETAASLAALGVSTIVVRPTTYAYTGGEPGPTKLGRGYVLLGRFPDGTTVWRVTAAKAPALATFNEGFSFTETPPRQPTTRWMLGSNAKVHLYAWRPGTYLVRFRLASYDKPRVVRIFGRGENVDVLAVAGQRDVTVPVQVPRGHSSVTIATRPGPEQTPDGRFVTLYVSNWQFLPLGRRRVSEPVVAAPE